MQITVYVSKTCQPCQEVRALIEEGRVQDKVRLVDIETDEGFEEFNAKVLSKGDSAVPSAFKAGEQCEMLYDDEEDMLLFKCPEAPEA